MASAVAALAAALFDQPHKLRPGERALVLCLACDRAQAKIILNYIKAYFTGIPSLAAMVQGEMTAEGFSLNNLVDIAVGTNSFRAVRGSPLLLGILDELAFWRDENSAKPDEELYRALSPALATLTPSAAGHRYTVKEIDGALTAANVPISDRFRLKAALDRNGLLGK
jgi:hypothetical protein